MLPGITGPSVDIPHLPPEAAVQSPASPTSSTATIPAQTTPYAKNGKLDDFNINQCLLQLNDQHFEKVQPDNPVFYLRAVRKNTTIREALKALPAIHPEIEALCKKIDAGDWDAVNHLDAAKISADMKLRYPDRPALHDIRIKDMLFYAFAANRISRMEFNTAHTVLNMKEQFGMEIQPVYKGKAFGIDSEARLPARDETIEMFRLFDTNTGKLSKDGLAYLNQVISNLKELHATHGVPLGFQEKDWFNRLEQAFRQLPENLQVNYRIGNSLADLQQKSPRSKLVFWRSQITPAQMPLIAAPNPAKKMPDGTAINDHFYSPSCGIEQAFLAQINPDYVQAVPFLGNIGRKKTPGLHLQNFHMEATRDDRALSNFLSPHDHMTGAWDASTHDKAHCFPATLHSSRQRKLCCGIFPLAINRTVKTGDEFGEIFADRINEELADMPTLRPHTMTPQDFLKNACNRAISSLLDRWMTPRESKILSVCNREENVNKCASFVGKALKAIKESRTGKLPHQTLGQDHAWQDADNFVKGLHRYAAILH